jgi:hypothetical protein
VQVDVEIVATYECYNISLNKLGHGEAQYEASIAVDLSDTLC